MVRECERLGVTCLGFTDHVNRTEDVAKHAAICTDLRQLDTSLDIYFGVEVNFLGCDGEFPIDEQVKQEAGFQFVTGGIHSHYMEEHDLYKLVDIQHRHHLRTCENPLVDVLVHPYWFSLHSFESRGWPYPDTMKIVPESYTRELGYVARETGTAIEINANACLVNEYHSREYAQEYVDYLTILAEEGVTFSLGSDAHDIGQLQEIRVAWDVGERLGLTEERVYRPECGSFV